MSDVSKNSDDKIAISSDVTGVILAGGKSSRYGRNKALEEIDGVRLIERVIRVLESTLSDLVPRIESESPRCPKNPAPVNGRPSLKFHHPPVFEHAKPSTPPMHRVHHEA